MLKLFSVGCLLLLALWGNSVGASTSYLLDQAYFEDKTNSLSLSEVETQSFTSYEGWLAKGYRPSTYWIRVTINPSEQDLILRIRPAYTEEIQLFDFSGPIRQKTLGAKYLSSNSDIDAFNHNFNLGASKDRRQLYLKLKSTRTYVLGLDVLPLSEFLTLEHTTSLFFVGYMVFMLSLALGLLGAWIANREVVLGAFVIQQFFAFFYTIIFYGYARFLFDRFISADVINFTMHIFVVVYPLLAIIANKILLEEYSLKRVYQYLFYGVICISIFAIALMLLGYIGDALQLNSYVILIAAVIFWLTALFGTGADKSSKNINLSVNVLRIYYTLNFVMFLVLILPLLGIIPSNELTAHSNLFYNIVSGLIFYFILQYRARSILRNEVLKSAAAQKEAENERLRREEQGKLMAMLAHEIRTPLSVLRLVVDNKFVEADLENYANRAVNNIDAIIDKCIQLDRLDFNALKIHKTQFNFSRLLDAVIVDSRSGDRFLIASHVDTDIFSDADIVRVIISNLISNSVKYSIPQSEITINSELISDQQLNGLQFSIQNHLNSIDLPDPLLVFDKYYRSPSAAKVSGSGLGLFLVRELVHAMHGEVKCYINNNSIIFTVWIPI